MLGEASKRWITWSCSASIIYTSYFTCCLLPPFLIWQASAPQLLRCQDSGLHLSLFSTPEAKYQKRWVVFFALRLKKKSHKNPYVDGKNKVNKLKLYTGLQIRDINIDLAVKISYWKSNKVLTIHHPPWSNNLVCEWCELNLNYQIFRIKIWNQN